MIKTPEDKVKDPITKYLRTLMNQGYLYFERRQASVLTRSGLPDMFMVIRGIHYEIEFKALGESLRADQAKWKERFERLDIKHIVVDNVEDFKEFVRECLDDKKEGTNK